MEYWEPAASNGFYFSFKHQVWISFDWRSLANISLNALLEQPNEFFVKEAIAVRNPLEFFSLQAVDFSQPDDEFILYDKTYIVKQYFGKYFFRDKSYQNNNFVYSIEKQLYYMEKNFQLIIDHLRDEIFLGSFWNIQRCIQYEDTILCFDSHSQGEYCSFNSRYWIPFNWNPCQKLSLDDVFEQPNKFYLEQTSTIYHPFYIKVYDEELHPSFRTTCRFQGEQFVEFICGSESELKRITQIATSALPEIQPLFEQYSELKVVYQSDENDTDGGSMGFVGIYTDNWQDSYEKRIFSKQTQHLFNLIFKFNNFHGFNLVLTKEGMLYCDGYLEYDVYPYRLVVNLSHPSHHEKLEAMFELQSWLKGKLQEEEIKTYFEGEYALNPPNLIEELKKLQINEDIEEDDVCF